MSVESITTGQAVVAAEPRFTLDNQPRQDLSRRLLRMEVCRRENGLDSLEVDFVHWGARSGEAPGFLLQGTEAVALGAQLVVQAGEDAAEATLFSGAVSKVTGVFGDGLPATMRIFAENALMRLRMSRHTRGAQAADDSRVIGEAVSAHGPSARVEAEPAQHAQYLQLGRTDLATLWERAEAIDARPEVDARGDVRVVARRQAERAPISLEWFNDLISFEVSADLAHQRAEVHVHGYDPQQKSGVHGRAARTVADAESDTDATGPRLVDALDLGAVEHVHLEAPSDARRAQNLAHTLALKRARSFVRGHGTTTGTPKMRVGDDVDLVGLDANFSGRYAVIEVRHVFDRTRGFRTHFVAERTWLGPGGAA